MAPGLIRQDGFEQKEKRVWMSSTPVQLDGLELKLTSSTGRAGRREWMREAGTPQASG